MDGLESAPEFPGWAAAEHVPYTHHAGGKVTYLGSIPPGSSRDATEKKTSESLSSCKHQESSKSPFNFSPGIISITIFFIMFNPRSWNFPLFSQPGSVAVLPLNLLKEVHHIANNSPPLVEQPCCMSVRVGDPGGGGSKNTM